MVDSHFISSGNKPCMSGPSAEFFIRAKYFISWCIELFSHFCVHIHVEKLVFRMFFKNWDETALYFRHSLKIIHAYIWNYTCEHYNLKSHVHKYKQMLPLAVNPIIAWSAYASADHDDEENNWLISNLGILHGEQNVHWHFIAFESVQKRCY